MKFSLMVAAGVLIAFPGNSRADLVIVQAVEGSGQSSQMVMKIKGDKTRADISPQISSLTDSASGDSVMLMHDQKSYMKISAQSTMALVGKMKKLHKPASAPFGEEDESGFTAPKATGKKQRIGEYDTQEFICQIGNANIHYWVAKDFPDWEKLKEQMLKNQENSLSQMLKGKVVSLKDLPGMPVRSEIEFNGQKIAYTVVSVKEQAVSPKEFVIPEGYQEMVMPSFEGK
jgi:hypothetical protein